MFSVCLASGFLIANGTCHKVSTNSCFSSQSWVITIWWRDYICCHSYSSWVISFTVTLSRKENHHTWVTQNIWKQLQNKLETKIQEFDFNKRINLSQHPKEKGKQERTFTKMTMCVHKACTSAAAFAEGSWIPMLGTFEMSRKTPCKTQASLMRWLLFY